jgi:hypothetical protein
MHKELVDKIDKLLDSVQWSVSPSTECYRDANNAKAAVLCMRLCIAQAL